MDKMNQLVEQICKGYEITKPEALELLSYNVEVLTQAADCIRDHFCGNTFDFCSIINGKSGKCSENCTYCAQSAHYNTEAEVYSLLEEEVIFMDALHHACEGVNRYSIVTSGKRLDEEDVEAVCGIYKRIHEDLTIKLCASHGLLDQKALTKLKEAGVKRYHNNLETSRSFFPQICTTHTYDEKLETIKVAQEIGLEVCSGGIFGLGESMEDRIDMAFELKALEVDSIPLNVLNPIPGTPLYGKETITEEAFLKAAAIYRFIHPTKVIRLAGGRNLLTKYGKLAFEGGVNGTITGDLLTTCGQKIADDQRMIEEIKERRANPKA